MPDNRPVILILDDEPMVTTTIRNYLDLTGEYQTVAFQEPTQALDYLRAHPVDLLVSDQIMPGMNGLEFLQQVKQIQPEAIRILLTGYAQKEDAIRAINQVGLYQYLEKPWNNDELGIIIRNGLERKRLYTSLQARLGELRIASGEIERLKNGLVELYLEKSPRAAGDELRRIVGSEVRSGARRLLHALVAVSVLLAASVSYIVFLSIRRETAGLKLELSEIRRQGLNEAEVRRLRATLAAAPSEQIIAEYQESVCFIQGAYLFRDRASGQALRRSSSEPVEIAYTGTGFLVAADGRILTNRHVAEPWWADPQAQKIVQAGYRPEFRIFVAYFPHRTQPFVLKTRKVSPTTDVALLEASPAAGLPKPALLDEGKAAAGAPVLLIGFPLGLEALLARASEKTLDQIPNLPSLSLDQVARELAQRNLIRPFITQGHLSDVSEEVLVYDAVTTMGGSGGPLFNRQGKVIGINFAVIPQFSGGSMGLPIRHALELLKD